MKKGPDQRWRAESTVALCWNFEICLLNLVFSNKTYEKVLSDKSGKFSWETTVGTMYP